MIPKLCRACSRPYFTPWRRRPGRPTVRLPGGASTMPGVGGFSASNPVPVLRRATHGSPSGPVEFSMHWRSVPALDAVLTVALPTIGFQVTFRRWVPPRQCPCYWHTPNSSTTIRPSGPAGEVMGCHARIVSRGQIQPRGASWLHGWNSHPLVLACAVSFCALSFFSFRESPRKSIRACSLNVSGSVVTGSPISWHFPFVTATTPSDWCPRLRVKCFQEPSGSIWSPSYVDIWCLIFGCRREGL